MFKGKTILERIDASTYKLNSRLTYENEKYKVTIKQGLVTDGASIPRIFWSLVGCPTSGKYVGSALIHDGLYCSEIISRKEADELFLDMLKDNGVCTIKRYIMFAAVRIGGYFVWKKHNPGTVEANKAFINVKTFENVAV